MKYFNLPVLGAICIGLFSCEKSEVKQEESLLNKAEVIFDKSYPEINDTYFNMKINHNDDLFLNGYETVIKVDKDGNLKWTVTGSPNSRTANDLAPTKDGGCIVLFVEQLPYSRKYSLVKISSAGAIEWEKTGENYEIYKIVVGDDDMIYGVADLKEDGYWSKNKPKLFKYTMDGEYLSSEFITDTRDEISYQSELMYKLNNNNFVVGTFSSVTPERENYDFHIVEFDKDANNISERNYGGYRNDHLMDIAECPDGGLILMGYSNSKDGDIKSWRDELTYENGGNAWVVRLGKNREIKWEKIMGGTEISWFRKAVYYNNKLLVAFHTTATDIDFQSPERPKGGFIVLDYQGNITDKKYIGEDMIYCAFDSQGFLIMLTYNHDDYYGTYTPRLIKIR